MEEVGFLTSQHHSFYRHIVMGILGGGAILAWIRLYLLPKR